MIGNFGRSFARAIAHRQALAADYGPSFVHILGSEGGYVDDPQDPGGKTNHGITQEVYDDWRRSHGQQLQDVRLIGSGEVSAIYRALYWDLVDGDDLPAGVDYATFDFAVNSGVHRAATVLQAVLGISPTTGHVGPITIAAAKAALPLPLIHSICVARLAYLETLPTWRHFGRGWEARVVAVEASAGAMA